MSIRSSAYSSELTFDVPSVIPSFRPAKTLESCSGIRLKSVGEVDAPYLTPIFTGHGSVRLPFSRIQLVSDLYIDFSMFAMSCGYPSACRMSNSCFRLIESNALRMSIKHACTGLPLVVCIWIISSNVSACWVHE
jgi:hypothetical protein